MFAALQRIARGVFSSRDAVPEATQFDHDSFEHVIGLQVPCGQCRCSASLDLVLDAQPLMADFPHTRPHVQSVAARPLLRRQAAAG